MNRLVVAVAILSFPGSATAQENAGPRNRIYLEALGNGIVYSVSYERNVAQRLEVRLGAGALPVPGVEYVLGYAMVGVRVGDGDHTLHLAAGAGVLWLVEVWLLEAADSGHPYGTASLAYQFQPRRRGLFLRAALTPVFAGEGAALWGGAGVGYAF